MDSIEGRQPGERRRRGHVPPRPVLFAVGLAAFVVVVVVVLSRSTTAMAFPWSTARPQGPPCDLRLGRRRRGGPGVPGRDDPERRLDACLQGELSLWLVMLAGGLGAIVGDLTLFLIARRSSSFVEPQLTRARAN